MKENNNIQLADGRRLGYAEYGDPKGKPLFFFHGWPGSRLTAKKIDAVAKKLHLKIISPDRPGYGLSDFKNHRNLLDWPDDVLELAKHLHIKRFSVVGISGGGPYAAVCAYKLPEKIIKIGIIVGLGPSHIPNAWKGIAALNKLSWSNYSRIPYFANVSAWVSMIQARYLPNLLLLSFRAKEDRTLINKNKLKEFNISMKQACIQGSKGPGLDLKIYTSPWGFDIKQIQLPVFLWYGEADKNVSLEMGKYYHSQIKSSKLIVYKNEGHLLLERHGEEILKTFR